MFAYQYHSGSIIQQVCKPFGKDFTRFSFLLLSISLADLKPDALIWQSLHTSSIPLLLVVAVSKAKKLTFNIREPSLLHLGGHVSYCYLNNNLK